MTTSSSVIIDGVEFKLSENLKLRQKPPSSLNIVFPDISSVLEDCNYDFTFEKNLLAHEARKKEIEEQKLRQRKENTSDESQETSPQSEVMDEDDGDQPQDTSSNNVNKKMNIHNFSASNPFLNDMFGNGILTPQKYTNDSNDVAVQNRSLDVGEFVDENQDPFTNVELETIDDLKELKDVLKNMGEPPKPMPRIRRHSLTDKDDEVTIKITKQEANDESKNSKPDASRRLLPKSRRSPGNSSPSGVTIPATSSLNSLPVTVPAGGFESMNHTPSFPETSGFTIPSVLQNHISSSPNEVTMKEDSKDTSSIVTNSPVFARHPFSNAVPLSPDTATSEMEVAENTYVNVSFVNKSKVLPKPAKELGLNKATTYPSTENVTPPLSYSSAPSSGTFGVQEKIFANKSSAERAKFEETINKALTSLPTLPQTVVTNKITTTKPGDWNASTAPKVSTIPSRSNLIGLPVAERKFAESILAMGFGERQVLLAIQKCGHKNREEVLDFLFHRQSLTEKGYPAGRVEDALDLFNEDVDKAQKYLDSERKLLNMGYATLRVKEALLLHDNDERKAIEDLVSNS